MGLIGKRHEGVFCDDGKGLGYTDAWVKLIEWYT